MVSVNVFFFKFHNERGAGSPNRKFCQSFLVMCIFSGCLWNLTYFLFYYYKSQFENAFLNLFNIISLDDRWQCSKYTTPFVILCYCNAASYLIFFQLLPHFKLHSKTFISISAFSLKKTSFIFTLGLYQNFESVWN